MLAPHELELLTAHVDGELTASQRAQVVNLLERSGKARDMLQWLEEDAHRLRTASPRTIPVDLSGDVLQEIGRLAQRERQKPKLRVRPFPVWRAVGAAAAVLVAVSTVAYYANLPKPGTTDGGSGVATKNPEENNPLQPDPDKGSLAKIGPTQTNDDKTATKSSDRNTTVVDNNPPKTVTPATDNGAILAAKGNDSSARMERVQLDVPTISKLHELHKAEHGKALTDRLTQLKAARVELTAKDSTKAFEKLQAAMTGKKIKLHVDPTTHTRLKKPVSKTDVVIYLENIQSQELLEILHEIAKADRAGDPHFDGAVVVKEMSMIDRKGLSELLGIDPTLPRSSSKRKPGLDIHRDLSEQTTREVVAALDGQGVPRPDNDANNHAYVSHLPYSKSRPPEVSRFLNLRKPAKAETIQVLLIVLRHVG